MGGNCERLIFSLVGIQICGFMTATRPPPLPSGTRGFFFGMISDLRSFPQPPVFPLRRASHLPERASALFILRKTQQMFLEPLVPMAVR